MEEPVRVIAIDERELWVETQRHSPCGGCAASAECGQALLDQLGARRACLALERGRELADVDVGETLVLGVPDHSIVVASALLYAVPLLGLVGGAWLGQSTASGDLAAALGALAGSAIACLAVRRFDGWVAGRHRPVARRRLGV